MSFLPILGRELLVYSRRRRTYIARMEAALGPLIVAGACFIGWFIYYGKGWHLAISHAEMAQLGQVAFGLVVAVQLLIAYIMCIEQTSRALARERDGRTLGLLLASPMSSAQIVLGTLAAEMLRCFGLVIVALPVSAALVLGGGIDPRFVPLAYAGILATAWMVAGISIWASAEAPSARAATRTATLVTTVWLMAPVVSSLLLTKLWPALGHLLNPALQWVAASSPLNLQMSFALGFGVMTPSRILREVYWMIGLETLGGAAFVLLAIVRLRKASRQVEGGDGGFFRSRRSPSRVYRILPRWQLGDDPMLWKDLTTIRQGGLGQLIGWCITVMMCLGFAYLCFKFLVPAFQEVASDGYSHFRNAIARHELNMFVRGMSVVGALVMGLVVAGSAAESIGVERRRDTWSSLLVTQLEGREILRAKLLAALWIPRWGYVALLVLWLAAVVAGGLHPLAVPAALLIAASWLWLSAAWGVYRSLVCVDLRQATNSTLLPFLATMACGLAPIMLAGRGGSVFMGIGSLPLQEAIALVSYSEAHELFRGGDFLRSGLAELNTGEGPLSFAAAFVLSFVASALGAWYLTRLANARFDAACNRPTRPVRNPFANRGSRLVVPASRPTFAHALALGEGNSTPSPNGKVLG